jgi:predicted RNA binding protein YcfA (HicA-like mRNA interferase family)
LTCNVYKYVYNKNMRKKILIKRLQELGWWKYGEGGSHEKWTNGEQKAVISRHTEVNEYTAEAIVKTAQVNPGNKRKGRT